MKNEVTSEECQSLRKLAHEGGTISSIAEQTNRVYSTVQRHILGRCTHEHRVPSVTADEAKGRPNITWFDCRKLREEAHAAESIKEISGNYDWRYEAILRHVKGNCSHEDVPVEPLQVEARSGGISKEKCEVIRSRYFEDRESLDLLAESFSNSRQTIWHHIRYRCSHYLPARVAYKHNYESEQVEAPTENLTDSNPLIEDMYSDEIRTAFIDTYSECVVSDVCHPDLLRVVPLNPAVASDSQELTPSEGLLLNGLLADAYRTGVFTLDTDGRLWVNPGIDLESTHLTTTLGSQNGIQLTFPEQVELNTSAIESRNEGLAWWPHPRA